MSSTFPDFDIVNPQVRNGTVVEASAGTGKTFSVAGFVARTVALNDDIRIGNVLVTTFTRNAAAELRDRVRRRLVSLERQLSAGTSDKDDPLAADLVGHEAPVRAARVARALREFDTATTSTIHSVCARILTMAGLPASGEADESALGRIIDEVVNDVVISEAFLGHVYEPTRLKTVVEARLGAPLSVLAYKPYGNATGKKSAAGLDHLVEVIEKCVSSVRSRTEREPTFDDLLRRAEELLSNTANVAVVAALRQRFRIALIDEAQDTDKLQWSIFRHIFDPDSTTHTLVAVGDPKQAIYRFRGADIQAYLEVRRDDRRLTLRRNWRSDSDLLEALNHLFEGWSFGTGIDYVPVTARDGAPGSAVSGTKPLTVIDLGKVGNKNRIVRPTAVRVREILETVSITKDGTVSRVRPGNICVLVTSRATGAAVESELREFGISAVSSGTENVMKGELATSWMRLLRAMDEPHDDSRIRLVAATPFFGFQLADAGALDAQRMEDIQRTVNEWARVMRTRGVAAVAARMRGDAAIAARLGRGYSGERRETDLAHVVELLHRATGGTGCTPTEALAHAAEIAARNDQSETVTRRVESDRDAVQIMTVHAAKGLEFPVVVVADLWKTVRSSGGANQFHRAKNGAPGTTESVIDAGYVVRLDYPEAKTARQAEDADEVKRLFYVALTRARHHVSLIVADKPDGPRNGGPRVTEGLADRARYAAVSAFVDVVPAAGMGRYDRYEMPRSTDEEPGLAPFGGSTERTYQRLSFSGIAKTRQGIQESTIESDDRSGAGHNDDDETIISIRSGYCADGIPLGVDSMPLSRLMGGTHFGKVMHAIYERVDFAATDLEAEVSRAVGSVAHGAVLRDNHDEVTAGIVLSLQTPLGARFGGKKLASLTEGDRLNELGFEMGLASVSAAVKVRDIGRVLVERLEAVGRTDDVLAPYARELASSAFEMPLIGLMNGSIDTLLRVALDGAETLWVTDWKSNRLDEDGMGTLIEGYSRARMCEEMEHHHYPLQALIYGTAVHRYVRARRGRGAGPAVAGLAYFFIRGMVGEGTPIDADGNRNGVFVWEAPDGLWEGLSDEMSGVTR